MQQKWLFMAAVIAVFSISPMSDAYAAPQDKCKACHKFTAKNSVGPGLQGIVGRTAGTNPGFKYKFTKYIKGDAWTWDEEHLRAWINKSKKAVKKFTGNKHAKTKMPNQHVKGADADALIAFLKGLK